MAVPKTALAAQLSQKVNRLMEVRNCTPGEQEDYPDIPEDIVSGIPFPFDTSVPALEIGLKTAFYIPPMILAIVGNFLVLVIIIKLRRLHTATCFYIANLAVSDFIVGAFNMWVHLVPSITANWPFGSAICNFSIFFRTLAIVASALFLTVIAGERFFSIVYPLKIRFTETYIHALIITLCWTIAVAVALPTVFTRKLEILKWRDYTQKYCAEVWPRFIAGPDPTSPNYCIYKYPTRQLYYTLQVAIMYGLPVVTMTIAYSVIHYTLHKRRAPGVQTAGLVTLVNRTKRKVLRMLVIVFGVYVICYTPQEVLTLYGVVRPIDGIPSWVSFLTVYMVYLNSALNPILYGGLNENFRKGLIDIIKCRCSTKISPTDALGQMDQRNLHTPVNQPRQQQLVARTATELPAVWLANQSCEGILHIPGSLRLCSEHSITPIPEEECVDILELGEDRDSGVEVAVYAAETCSSQGSNRSNDPCMNIDS